MECDQIQNINATVSAGIQSMQQNNNTATQPCPRPNGSHVIQVMNHMLKPPKPDKFDGETEKVDSFLEQLEYILEYYQVPATERTRAGSKWLTGPAMNWYLFMKNRDPSFEYCDWHEFKSSLSKQFKIQNIEQIARDKLYYLKQNGSVMKYNEIFNKLIM